MLIGNRLDWIWKLGFGMTAMLGGLIWYQSEQTAAIEPPKETESPRIPEHVAQDPVFQELSKAFFNAGQSTQAVQIQPGEISDTVWHAVESMLRTARQLEAEEAKCKAAGEPEKAKKHREIINSLRWQGTKLLANELQIPLS